MRIVNRPEQEPNLQYLARLAEEYKRSKETLTEIEKRTNGLKKELSDFVDANGIPDDKGHLWFTAGDVNLKRERRVSRSLDRLAAEQWAVENGYWDVVKEVVEVLDEDKLLGLAWTNKALEEIIQSFFVEKENWAFKL